mgnify:CR=1 FL=1
MCNTGFSSGAAGCEDVDECQLEDQCGENGQCINLPGFFQCVCDEGYRKSGGLCVSKCPKDELFSAAMLIVSVDLVLFYF